MFRFVGTFIHTHVRRTIYDSNEAIRFRNMADCISLNMDACPHDRLVGDVDPA